MDKTNLGFYGPVLVIGFKGHPINRFVAEIYVKGEEVYKTKTLFIGVIHEDLIHAAYERGVNGLESAMKDEGLDYQLKKYHVTLREYATRRYFKTWIKRKLYKFYLLIGKAFG